MNAITGECVPKYCSSWRCARCGPRKQRRFAHRISECAEWKYFVTLTVQGDGSLSTDNNKKLNRSWRTLWQWLKRNAKATKFTWVNELGSLNYRLHKHAVISCKRFDYSRARKAVLRAGFGPVCDFQRIRKGAGAATKYVSKYLSKTLATKLWPRFSRRCQTNLPKSVASPGWTFFKCPQLPHQSTLMSLPYSLDYKRQTASVRSETDVRRDGLGDSIGNLLPENSISAGEKCAEGAPVARAGCVEYKTDAHAELDK